MGEVINFPTRSVRDWSIIERAMNEALVGLHVPPAAQKRLREQMKSFYEFLDPDFSFSIEATFPATVPQDQVTLILSEIGEKIGVASEKKLQSFTQKIFLDRLEREVNFCRELGLF